MVLEADVAGRVEGSMAIDVVSFSWTYINEGSHLVVQGEAVNNTGKPQQAVTLVVRIYDEEGQPVGASQSIIVPTYLPTAGQGKFDLIVMPKRTKGIKHLRLSTRAAVLQ